ncbi:hypothetical protein BKA70DRAFT_1231709 [Coprinopsis sp. MPI-PUGE-AT-0042]|nr:hypothetical protein BKA70DRAFT_1231709 [Coprinopsis sp. MPI-PUGE-AT-0042]
MVIIKLHSSAADALAGNSAFSSMGRGLIIIPCSLSSLESTSTRDLAQPAVSPLPPSMAQGVASNPLAAFPVVSAPANYQNGTRQRQEAGPCAQSQASADGRLVVSLIVIIYPEPPTHYNAPEYEGIPFHDVRVSASSTRAARTNSKLVNSYPSGNLAGSILNNTMLAHMVSRGLELYEGPSGVAGPSQTIEDVNSGYQMTVLYHKQTDRSPFRVFPSCKP